MEHPHPFHSVSVSITITDNLCFLWQEDVNDDPYSRVSWLCILLTLSCDTVESECHFSLSFALCQLPTHGAEGIFDRSHDGFFSLLSLRYVIRPRPASRRISLYHNTYRFEYPFRSISSPGEFIRNILACKQSSFDVILLWSYSIVDEQCLVSTRFLQVRG